MTQKPHGKKLVYVSEDIVDSISEITQKRGESITKFVEDILVDSHNSGKALQSIVEKYLS